MFAFLAAHRAEVFPDAGYADLFSAPGLGRPSIPATQMAAVLTLQALYDYSDRETAEAVRFDVRWKAAIGAPLDDPGFGPSSLVYWRRRLAESARPHRVNNAVKTVMEQTGMLQGRRRRAVDSTILDDAVATQNTVTQLMSAIRKVAREVPGAAEQITAVCAGHDYGKPGKPKIDWDDPAAKDALVSRWWPTRTRCWPRSRRGAGGAAAAAGRCWRWSPGRTWSPPRAATGPTGGGGSPARSPRTG